MNDAYKKMPKYEMLPFDVIKAAVSGDVDAIRKVVKHYERYICSLATKQPAKKNRQTSSGIDHELKQTLETQLITKILTFTV